MKVELAPAKEFYWPYYLYIPGSLLVSAKENRKNYLLVEPNNPPRGETEYLSPDIYESAAKEVAERGAPSAKRLGVPFLVPVFPGSPLQSGVYTGSLDRKTILIQVEKLKRLDLQLIAMIDDAIGKLSQEGINVEKRVLMSGYSGSGMFVERFTVLHPQRVQAAAVGAPGGLPIVPVAEWSGAKLKYPFGVWDIKELVGEEFDVNSFKSVPLYFYMGDKDTNDVFMETILWSEEDRQLIFQYFGDVPVKRWPIAEKIYKSVGCSSKFTLYPGVEHGVVTQEMRESVTAFFLNNLAPR